MPKLPVFVLDSCVFIEHGNSPLPSGTLLTVTRVLEEVKDGLSRLRKASIPFSVEDPRSELVAMVKQRVKQLPQKLSETDANLLALSLEKKGTLITDDYAIQNAASIIGVSWLPWGKRGIKKIRK